MTAYKAYGNGKTVPSRMARKKLRSEVFQKNQMAAKAERKARRLARKQAEREDEDGAIH
jgi:hypothetical protein